MHVHICTPAAADDARMHQSFRHPRGHSRGEGQTDATRDHNALLSS
jgi:hypothetical protein